MSKIDHKTVTRIFLFIIIAVTLGLFISQLTQKGSELKNFDHIADGWTLNGSEVSLPVSTQLEPGQIYELSNSLPEKYTGNDVILFKSENIFWKLSVGDQVIDEFTPADIAPGHTAGDHWNFILMPDNCEGKEFTLEFYATYGVSSRMIREVFFVDRGLATDALLQAFLPAYALSIFSIACAFMIILSTIVLTDPKNRDLTLVYLGLFVIAMSFWSIGQSPMLNLVYSSFSPGVYLTYLSIPFAVGFGTLYCIKLAQFPMLWINKLAVFLPFTLVIIDPILEFTGIMPFGVSIIFVDILMINMSFMVLFASNRIIYRRFLGTDSSILITIASLALLAVSWLDVYQTTYLNGNDYAKNTRVLMFVYLLAISYDRLVVFTGFRRKMEEAKIMSRMAFIDGLTGVQNRLAFNKKLEEIKDPTGVAFVSFDVNNLKSTNDGYGHAEGDKLICAAAQIITDSLSFTDYVYRYGGDEFVVIIENTDLSLLEQSLDHLESLERDIDATHDFHLAFAIAYGYAIYDPERDKALSDTLVRADHNMYKKKFIMKQELI